MATATLEQGSLVVSCRYDADLVDELKKAIPYTERRWDRERKAWLVDPKHEGLMANLISKYLGEALVSQKSFTFAQTTALETLDVRYVGATKERADGSQTAYGWVNGEWSVVFSEIVLREWFEGVQLESKPGERTTLFGVLGIMRDCKPEEIKSAYRRMAKQWHPDVCKEPGAEDQFKRINEAYQILSDPDKRERYCAGLQLESQVSNRDNYDREFFKPLFQGYRSPLRCGLILAEGEYKLGRFYVSKILLWEDIVDDQGRTLVTSWSMGAQTFTESWV